jgi:hypothetical protein
VTARRVALASALCAGLLVASLPTAAQDLGPGRGRGRAIEGGPVNVERLVERADLIVRGLVTRKEPRWIGRVLYTQYELEVQETLKGAERKNVLVSVVGGTLGNVQLTVPGAPSLQAGDQIVFFGQPLAGATGFTPLGTFDGIVPVQPGRGNGVATASPRGQPEPLTAFLQEIRTLSKRP